MSDYDETAKPDSLPPPIPNQSAVVDPDNIVTTLLKAPALMSEEIAGEKNLIRSAFVLLATAIVCHAIFGFALGLFGGLNVAIMDILKIPLIAVCSLLLCFPSLYVFSCVAGAPLSLSQTFMLGCSCLAMVGLLLVGLAPVAWLFAVSTESITFVAILALTILFVALVFAGRYIGKLQHHVLFKQQAGIKIWVVIITVVALQMATCMRPIITAPEKSWWTNQKAFFLSHFGNMIEDEAE